MVREVGIGGLLENAFNTSDDESEGGDLCNDPPGTSEAQELKHFTLHSHQTLIIKGLTFLRLTRVRYRTDS